MRIVQLPVGRQRGATLVEMVAAVIILSIVLAGVAQYLLVSRISVYTTNVRSGVIQNLSDAIVQCQSMPVGQTNIPVNPDLLPHVPSGIIRVEKSGPTNGTYSVTGSVTWRAFPKGDGNSYSYHETLTLLLPD